MLPAQRSRRARSRRARAAQRDRRCRRARPARTRDASRRAGPASPGECASTASTQVRETSSKARQALAEPLAQVAEQLDGGARAVERDPGGRRGAGLREEPQHRGGDDAERALGAEEKLLQVVAGVVLAQRRAGRPRRGRRAAPPRGRAPARAPCRSAARSRRRRWWRGCRRSGSCPPRRARAETGAPRPRRLSARRPARTRPRP